MKHAHLLPLAVVCVFSAVAEASPFFSTHNQAGFARSFLLPALGDAQVEDDDTAHQITLDHTNEFFAQTTPTESVIVDGETTRLAYRLQLGSGQGWEWQFELPLLVQGGGFMDGFTEDWHDTFGLPNGGRERAPRNRYLYQVTQRGQVVFLQTATGSAQGDARVSAGWQAAPGLALRAAVQLPTGSRSQFTGGNAGLAVWSDYALPFEAGSDWEGFVSLGGSVAQESDVLPQWQRKAVGLGGAGLAWRWSPSLQFVLQASAHTALYRGTELEALSRPGVQTSFGLTYALAPGTRLQLGLQEDLVSASSPDFSLYIALALH